AVQRSIPDWADVAARLETRVTGALPDSLFDWRQNSMRALLRVPPEGPDALAATVWRMYDEVAGTGARVLAVGLSGSCSELGSFSSGFEEARIAAEIGALIGGGAGVFTDEGLGPYRSGLLADGSVRVQHQGRLERL